ncbi:hypothetical protein Gpo141_00011294, partial [Globisporangium polare]
MDGARHGGTGGGAGGPGAGRLRQSQQQQQQQWPARPSSSAVYLPAALPGIAVFLHHQQMPLARRFQAPEQQQQQQRQQPSGPVTQQAYPIYNQAYG